MFSLLTSAKSFKTNRWVGSARLNQLGLHVGRKRMADGLAALRRRWLGRLVPVEDQQSLAQDGLLVKPGFLTPAEISKERAELLSALWQTIEMAQTPASPRRVNLDAQLCEGKFPALARLITHPALLRALRFVAGCPRHPHRQLANYSQ